QVTVPEGVCPFCGERLGPGGVCACSPVAPAPVPGAAPAPGSAPAPASSAAPAAAPTSSAVDAPVAGATQSVAGLRLVGATGEFAGQIIPLSGPEVTIGREPGRDLVLPDPSVSRRHARLIVDPDAVEIVDEGSSNGT